MGINNFLLRRRIMLLFLGLIDGAFADLPGRPGQSVRYKVRAVDYRGRAGAFSELLEVTVPHK